MKSGGHVVIYRKNGMVYASMANANMFIKPKYCDLAKLNFSVEEMVNSPILAHLLK